MAKSRLPPKKDVALALLESSSVFVHLDPRAEGVTVPPWFKKQPQLVLQIGLNMPVPIPDLSVDAEGVSCTLSFNRSPQFCNVPWKAIYALVGEDGRGMVWPEDVPPEVAAQSRATPAAEPKTKKKKKPHLRAVAEKDPEPESQPDSPEQEAAPASNPSPEPSTRESGDAEENSTEGERESTPPSRRKLPPYLRVVK